MDSRYRHTVRKVLHRPMHKWGVDKWVLGASFMLGALCLMVAHSYLVALAVGGSVFAVARVLTELDRQIWCIVKLNWRARSHYDAAKCEAAR